MKPVILLQKKYSKICFPYFWRPGCDRHWCRRLRQNYNLRVIRFKPVKTQSEGVPLVLILVPSKEQVLAVIDQFESLNTNKSVLIVGLYAAPV